mmetsp:Transcript_5744/g.14692  ORF Transcript_5744/g.14692 Transcript_5744/m.14692 type:complete len:434 (+) Transcript_5744:784-2085(+)
MRERFCRLLREAELGQRRRLAHEKAGVRRNRVADSLRDERNRAARTRVRLNQEHALLRLKVNQLAVVARRVGHRGGKHGVLQVDETHHLELARKARNLIADDVQALVGHRLRGQEACRVAAVNTSLLDVLHDARYRHVALDVAEGVHVQLRRIREVLVDENRRIVGVDGHRVLDEARKVLRRVHDFHGTSTEHKARTNHDRKSDAIGDLRSIRRARRHAARWLRDVQLRERVEPLLPVLRKSDGRGGCAPDAHVAVAVRGGDRIALQLRLQWLGELERRLASKLHNDAVRSLDADDAHHILNGKRLKVEAVRRVVVRRHRLWVRVDHDRLEAGGAQRIRSVAAAVVKFNALPNAVRSTAEDHHLRRSRGSRLAAGAILTPRGRRDRRIFRTTVRAVHVRRVRLKLRRARVHPSVHRLDAAVVAALPHLNLAAF